MRNLLTELILYFFTFQLKKKIMKKIKQAPLPTPISTQSHKTVLQLFLCELWLISRQVYLATKGDTKPDFQSSLPNTAQWLELLVCVQACKFAGF